MAEQGQLIVYYGCMFAGKTTALINYISNANLKPNELLVFKPGIDNRAAKNIITTHDGKKHECISLENETVFSDLVTPYTKLIAIDEAQFFDKLIFSELKRLLTKGVSIVAAGLDKDYLARPFGLMPLLMQSANELKELNAKCECCGGKATHTYRKETNKVLVLIGSEDYYQARCADCYRIGVSANNAN